MGEQAHHDQPQPGDEITAAAYSQAYEALQTMAEASSDILQLPDAMDALKIVCLVQGTPEQRTETNRAGVTRTSTYSQLIITPENERHSYRVQVVDGATNVSIWDNKKGHTTYQFFQAETTRGGEPVDVMARKNDREMSLVTQAHDNLAAHENMHQVITTVVDHVPPTK